MQELHDLREDYGKSSLDEKALQDNPISQLSLWLDDASAASIKDVNAMVLSTVDSLGQPSSRVVLLRELSSRGLGFFTNYASQKGVELHSNPQASLLFFWRELQRQVRVEGLVEKMPADASDAYFASRPRGSQIGAWSSPQSASIPSRERLEEAVRENERKFSDGEVPRPSFWGGYLLQPRKFEFWQGRKSRLHDRLIYRLDTFGLWQIDRVAP